MKLSYFACLSKNIIKFDTLIKSKLKIMAKVYPLNTAIPVKNNDDTYNYLYGITCGLCICVTLCVLIIFIIVYSIENDSSASY